MKSDRLKWDERYQKGNHPSRPSEIVQRFAPLAENGTALDIAAGNGRNSIFLANLGFQVDAVDISRVGLGYVRFKNSAIKTIQADLDDYVIKPASYNLIININFLKRRLFQPIINGLKDNGLLIFQSFLNSNETDREPSGSGESYYLAKDELKNAFYELDILHYEENRSKSEIHHLRQISTLVARKQKE